MNSKVKTEAPSLPGFRLDQTFFGLDVKDRPKIHDLIFDLVWIGEGRWDWNTIYNMPIFLRNFYIKKLNKMTEDRKKQQTKQQQSSKSKKSITKPPF